MAFLTVNIDTRGVIAELKGIRAAQESTAKVMAEILEAVKVEPPPSPDETQSQALIDELTAQLKAANDRLAVDVADRK